MNSGSGKLALVTGASSGIGLELARLFARDAYDVVLVSENRAELESAARELRESASGKIEVLEADLATDAGPRKVFEGVHGRTVDVLVNNAGIGVYGDFTRETSFERELEMIRLNVIGTTHLTKLFAPLMVERGEGRILFTASVASKMPTPLLNVYGATKAYVYEFAMGLREELSDTGVSVTALMPGPTDTNFFDRADAQDSKIVDEKLTDPATVAEAGYAALMRGDAKVVTPLKYKVQTAINQVVPDRVVAKQSHKKHERKDDVEERSEERG
jgi:short-subunit dehydrogenase